MMDTTILVLFYELDPLIAGSPTAIKDAVESRAEYTWPLYPGDTIQQNAGYCM